MMGSVSGPVRPPSYRAEHEKKHGGSIPLFEAGGSSLSFLVMGSFLELPVPMSNGRLLVKNGVCVRNLDLV